MAGWQRQHFSEACSIGTSIAAMSAGSAARAARAGTCGFLAVTPSVQGAPRTPLHAFLSLLFTSLPHVTPPPHPTPSHKQVIDHCTQSLNQFA